MSTVLICRELPYPPTSGSPLRMWQQLNLLAKRGPVHVFSLSEDHPPMTEMPLATTWEHVAAADVRIRRWPGPLRILRALFPPQYPATFGDFADTTIDARLRAFIERAQPTHVILSHWNSAMPSALRGKRRKFSVILDSHNVEWRLESDRRAERGLVARIRNWGFRRREKSLFERADKSWVTSDDDRKSAELLTPSAVDKIIVWPNAIDVDAIDDALAASINSDLGLSKQWPTIIFVGYMAYRPNEAAALLAITKMFPEIQSRFPNARLLIVGKDPRPIIAEAAKGEPNIVVTGTVTDVRPYLAIADIAIVPLSIGGGTRLKVLEAFAARIPLVSTSKGAEGIAVAGSSEVTIEDDLDAFGSRIIALLENELARTAQVEAGRALVEKSFSWASLSDRLDEALSLISVNG